MLTMTLTAMAAGGSTAGGHDPRVSRRSSARGRCPGPRPRRVHGDQRVDPRPRRPTASLSRPRSGSGASAVGHEPGGPGLPHLAELDVVPGSLDDHVGADVDGRVVHARPIRGVAPPEYEVARLELGQAGGRGSRTTPWVGGDAVAAAPNPFIVPFWSMIQYPSPEWVGTRRCAGSMH